MKTSLLASAAAGLFLAAGLGALAATARLPDESWYWQRPVPPQGRPPTGYLDLAKGLAPTDCAACHPRQFADWKTSLHAHSFSPGLEWQLLEMDPEARASCQSCHAPLAEQLDPAARGSRRARFDANLRSAGVTCAACHVRQHVRYGPPKAPGHDPGIALGGKPHGEVIRSEFFESSQFCAACHQFPTSAEAPNGKPLENTIAEWEASPYAVRGVSCQACHMPDRRHLWRGIHDPEMVRRGITLELLDDGAARLTNTGVGHMFPTYVTPRIVVESQALDAAGRPLASRSAIIERAVDLTVTPSRELSDTRLAPGASLVLPAPAVPGVHRIRARVLVFPDHFYERMFAEASRERHAPEVRRLLAEAWRRSRESGYVALEADRPLQAQ